LARLQTFIRKASHKQTQTQASYQSGKRPEWYLANDPLYFGLCELRTVSMKTCLYSHKDQGQEGGAQAYDHAQPGRIQQPTPG
jgi:hypothetical protein